MCTLDLRPRGHALPTRSGVRRLSRRRQQQPGVHCLIHIGKPPEGYPEEPVGVVRRCLQAMRMSDPQLLRTYLVPGLPTLHVECVTEGGRRVGDGGVFAAEAGPLDVGTRRIAPMHLLRRSEIRSGLTLGPRVQQGVFACAKGGEEALLNFSLVRVEDSDGGARWCVQSIARDRESDGEIPTGLAPRFSPEAVATAALTAARAGDLEYAERYFVEAPSASPVASSLSAGRSAGSASSSGTASGTSSSSASSAAASFQELTRNLVGFSLGLACLPDERTHLQQVQLYREPGGVADCVLYLTLTKESCWGLAGVLSESRLLELPPASAPVL
jgi:hypothetical protein